MDKKTIESAEMPAGVYVMCDPYHIMPDDLYAYVMDLAKENGILDGNNVGGKIEVNSIPLLIYRSEKIGLYAIIPIELCSKEKYIKIEDDGLKIPISLMDIDKEFTFGQEDFDFANEKFDLSDDGVI